MSNNKHTPGPWLARRMYRGFSEKYTPYVSAGDTSKVLCFMNISGAYGGFSGQEQAEADARLIAAAPELLEALEEITRQHRNVRAAEGYPTDSNSIIAAMAAIAKARGEA